MKRKVLIILALSLAVNLWTITALPQAEEEKPQLFMVFDEGIKPSKVAEYEAAAKEFFAQCAKHNFPYPFYTYSTNDFHYYGLVPLENFAAIDDFKKATVELINKMGAEQFQSIAKRIYDSYSYVQHVMYYHRPELSYVPENPRLKPEEENFYSLAFIYINYGKEQEFEQNLKEWISLYKSKNIPDGWWTFVGDKGTEKPVYVLAEAGRNAADYYSQLEKTEAALGEEVAPLRKKAMALVRKLEFKIGMFRPDLSYTPKEK